MGTATSTTPAPTQGLRRELALASTTSAVIGGIIAVGIFLTPAGMAKALGSPMWLLLVWLVIGAMTLSGALCFVVRNGEKEDAIKVMTKGDKKIFRTIQIRVGPNEITSLIRQGENWAILERWVQAGSNLSLGRFGFYIPGNDQVALSSFGHYV